MGSAPHVVVIGAGLSGLAAAARLRARGFAVSADGVTVVGKGVEISK